MKHLLLTLAVFLICLCSVSAIAQTEQLEITRNVNLRADPSTDQTPIKLLHPPDKLTLLSLTKVGGYYHVRTTQGNEGWVWAKNVELVGTSGDVTFMAVPEAAPAASKVVAKTWFKPPIKNTAFQGREGTCSSKGNGQDEELYQSKNRADTPKTVHIHDVTWGAINRLDFPGRATKKNYGPKELKDWPAKLRKTIDPYIGIPVRVVGYINKISPQTGNMEGTNCRFHLAGDVDAHIALVENPGDGEETAIVVEWTPRFLMDHPKWKAGKLKAWVKSEAPVRITGFLLFDPEHFGHLPGPTHKNPHRGTLWEIHPITQIEVWKDGEFVSLDDLP